LLLLIHFMRALITSILINVLLLIYFKKKLLSTLWWRRRLWPIFWLIEFRGGSVLLGIASLFIFNSLTLLTHSHSHSHFKSFSHLSFIYILPLSNKFNLLFGSKVLTVRRGPTLGRSLPPHLSPSHVSHPLRTSSTWCSAPLRCATWLGLFFCPCFRHNDRVLKTMI
jgi:hypothetical protein